MSRRPAKSARSYEIEGVKSNEESDKNEVSEATKTLPREKTKTNPESATTLETGTSRTTFQIESMPENETAKKESPRKEEAKRSFISPQKSPKRSLETHPEVPKKPIFERSPKRSIQPEIPQKAPSPVKPRSYRAEPISRQISREHPKSRETFYEPEYPRSREPSLEREYPKSRETSPEREYGTHRRDNRRYPRERSRERDRNHKRNPQEAKKRRRSREKEINRYKRHPDSSQEKEINRYKRHPDSSQEKEIKKRGHLERSDDDVYDGGYDRGYRERGSREREGYSRKHSRERSPKKKGKKRKSYDASEEEVCCCTCQDDKKVVFCVPSDERQKPLRYCCFVEANPKSEKRRSINPNLPSSKTGYKRGPKNDELCDIFSKNDPFPLQDLCEQKKKTRRVPAGYSCCEEYPKGRPKIEDKFEKEDEDKLFLLSMLPTLEKLNEPVKMDAKIQIMQIMQRYVYSKPKF